MRYFEEAGHAVRLKEVSGRLREGLGQMRKVLGSLREMFGPTA